jgi:peptidoglycan hydrolase-like protein with peptidoglycan-binding domain
MAIELLQVYRPRDYLPIPPRMAGVKYKLPNKRGWGPGHPNGPKDKISVYQANRLTLEVHDDYARLITLLVKMENALGHDLRKRIDPQGGWSDYDPRYVSGTRISSYHAWGLATDQNTTGNRRRKFSPQAPSVITPEIVWLLESCGHDSGVRYRPPSLYDPMHNGYAGRPEDVDDDIENAWVAFEELTGGRELYPMLWETNPHPNAAMIRVLQFRLAEHGYLVEDNAEFGPAMSAMVAAFQREKKLRADRIVGPLTWAALNEKPVEADHEQPDEQLD